MERNRFRALFDAVPDPVSILSWDGTVLDLNKAGMAAYNRPRADIIGNNIDILNPDLPRDHLAPVWEVLNRGGTYVVEVTNMRADGTRFPVEVHSAGFFDEGSPRIVAVARDLSKRHEAEVRYRELMELLDNGMLVGKGKNAPQIYRVMFYDITKNAIQKAFEKPLTVNLQLVDAQQYRLGHAVHVRVQASFGDDLDDGWRHPSGCFAGAIECVHHAASGQRQRCQ